jgi:hypothetical protein
VRELLEALEGSGAAGNDLLVPLAYLASRRVLQDEVELNAAVRRAELLLATGGDPRRPLDPEGRAVAALAHDLDTPVARAELAVALAGLQADAEGLPGVGEALRELVGESELAWRCYASAILADSLTGD